MTYALYIPRHIHYPQAMPLDILYTLSPYRYNCYVHWNYVANEGISLIPV